MKEGKNFKILGVRQSLIGDCVCALPVLNWLEQKHPNSFKYWHLAKKCSQAAPLFFNHKLINQIVITDCEEGFGPKDMELAKECDLLINTMPPHYYGEDWYNYRDIYFETFLQAGLSSGEYNLLSPEEKKPRLYRWFNKTPKTKVISLWGFAGYGNGKNRSPSVSWWENLICELKTKNFLIARFGTSNEPFLRGCDFDYRNSCFFDQIKESLNCCLNLGTDSGSSLTLACFNEIPQITLLTNFNVGHFKNFHALAPNNNKNITFFAENGCDNINQKTVLEKVKEYV